MIRSRDISHRYCYYLRYISKGKKKAFNTWNLRASLCFTAIYNKVLYLYALAWQDYILEPRISETVTSWSSVLIPWFSDSGRMIEEKDTLQAEKNKKKLIRELLIFSFFLEVLLSCEKEGVSLVVNSPSWTRDFFHWVSCEAHAKKPMQETQFEQKLEFFLPL